MLLSDRPVNPMQMVIDYMRDKELRPTELFRSFDKDTLNKLTKDQMVDQLKVSVKYNVYIDLVHLFSLKLPLGIR